MDIQLPKKATKVNFSSLDRGTQHTIFEVVLLIIVGVLIYMFLLQPKLAELATTNNQLQTLQVQNDSIQKNKQTLASLIAKLHSSPQQVAELDEALPLDGRQTLYRIAMTNIVNSSGMKVGDMSIEAGADTIAAGNKAELANPYSQTRKLKKFTASINLSGTFDQFISFLKTLENSGRIIDINNIEILSSKDNLLEFKLSTQSYYYE